MRIDDQWCQEALKAVKDVQANVLVTSLNRHYNYDECKQFDVVASCTTGTDHIDNRDIPIISLQGETEFLQDVWATAEMTWALIMSLVRKVPWAFGDVKQGNWNREAFQGVELRGKNLLIVGYGRVGRQVAKFAEAFGMVVGWYDTGICKPTKDYQQWFNNALGWADIITVHVPLSAETKGMFGMEQFRIMRPTAYFVNTSRGQIVNTYDLVHALRKGIIAGAALDVLDGEPEVRITRELIEDLGNLIVTPHLGGQTKESRKKTQIYLASKIKEWLNVKGYIQTQK